MLNNILKYKDFIGSVNYSNDDEIFYGKIEGINDLVTFEGDNVSQLKKSFQDAVNDYLQICEFNNKEPLKSFKGSFNVRINPELHKKAVFRAAMDGVSLNQLVQDAIECKVNRS